MEGASSPGPQPGVGGDTLLTTPLESETYDVSHSESSPSNAIVETEFPEESISLTEPPPK